MKNLTEEKAQFVQEVERDIKHKGTVFKLIQIIADLDSRLTSALEREGQRGTPMEAVLESKTEVISTLTIKVDVEDGKKQLAELEEAAKRVMLAVERIRHPALLVTPETKRVSEAEICRLIEETLQRQATINAPVRNFSNAPK